MTVISSSASVDEDSVEEMARHSGCKPTARDRPAATNRKIVILIVPLPPQMPRAF